MAILDNARFIVDVLAAKMGSDILVLDLSALTIIADYFVIATGETERQLNAMLEGVTQDVATQYGLKPRSVEGTAASGWVLIDYGSIVVHLFDEAQRNRYQLENLWHDAHTVVRMA